MQSIAEQEEALTTGELDLSAGSISFEAGQMEEGAFTAQGGTGNPPPQPMPEVHRLEREYIWGPGDSFAGVDELFVLFDREREPWLVLQDASGDDRGVRSPATECDGGGACIRHGMAALRGIHA
jgi:hypothetical protein